MAQDQHHSPSITSIQEPIRIRVDIDPGNPFSLTPEPQLAPEQSVLPQVQAHIQQQPLHTQSQPILQPEPQPQTRPEVQSEPQLPPGAGIDQAWPPATQQDVDNSSSTSSLSATSSSSSCSSSSSTSSSDTETQEPPEDEEQKSTLMRPIFDAPFRTRMEIPHHIPNHAGYFYGPGGSAMYAGGQTLHYGVGGQKLTPGQEQANAQLAMQGMGLVSGNVGMGGMHMHVWQQPYCGWM